MLIIVFDLFCSNSGKNRQGALKRAVPTTRMLGMIIIETLEIAGPIRLDGALGCTPSLVKALAEAPMTVWVPGMTVSDAAP